MDLIKSIENEFLKEDLPSFGAGDTVKVNVKVSEGNRERIQTFEGVIIAINGVGEIKLLQLENFLLVLVSKEFFQFMLQLLIQLKLLEKVK